MTGRRYADPAETIRAAQADAWDRCMAMWQLYLGGLAAGDTDSHLAIQGNPCRDDLAELVDCIHDDLYKEDR